MLSQSGAISKGSYFDAAYEASGQCRILAMCIILESLSGRAFSRSTIITSGEHNNRVSLTYAVDTVW